MPETRCGFDDINGGAKGHELLVSYGPTIMVDIGFDAAYVPQKGGKPVAGLTNVTALVDTGATASCIDSLLASQLNLPIVDKQITAGVHGALEVNMHLAQIHIPSLGFTIYGQFAGVHLQAGGQPHRALLGRTFLRAFKFVYEGHTGTVTISTP